MKKELLLQALKSLEDSTYIRWSNGDVEDWADHANKMKQAIQAIAPIIKIVAENLEETIVTPISEKND